MGSADALAAATSVAADAFGVADRGRFAEGHLADLVRGDLEEDVSCSYDVVAIWKDGYLVERAVGFAGAGAQAEAASAPAETLVADFEDGFEASFGEWDVTTDQLTGGSSSANVAVRDGALAVTGEIAPGLAFPWAGVIWMPGEQPMQPIDFSGREVIRFRTRGDGRQYSVMLIGGGGSAVTCPRSARGRGADGRRFRPGGRLGNPETGGQWRMMPQCRRTTGPRRRFQT